jgi:hypothetical protein
MDRETIMLMNLSQQNFQAMKESSAEKFRRGMRILYEDEYALLNKI